jgi:hypothetical protein
MTPRIPSWERPDIDADLQAAFLETEEKADRLTDGIVVLVVEKVRGHVRAFTCRTRDGASIASVMTEPPRRR